jgi:hypothetical protein
MQAFGVATAIAVTMQGKAFWQSASKSIGVLEANESLRRVPIYYRT